MAGETATLQTLRLTQSSSVLLWSHVQYLLLPDLGGGGRGEGGGGEGGGGRGEGGRGGGECYYIEQVLVLSRLITRGLPPPHAIQVHSCA